jgi:hypothetical protein
MLADVQARDVALLRLRRQGILNPGFEAPADAVGWLGAVQAQEYAVAKWSIGQRCLDVSEAAVSQAIAEGSIIRTHALRPTWHFLAAEDARWVLGLTAPRIKKLMAYYDRQLDVDASLISHSRSALTKALEGGRRLIRRELTAALEAAGITGTGQRIGHLLLHAELDAVICSGGLKGRQHAYALFDEIVPARHELSSDEALTEFTLRYFRSHGPATVRDYAAWCSSSITDARRGITMCGDALQSLEMEGLLYWYCDDLEPPGVGSPSALLLQGYDEYIMGYTESRRFLDVAGLIAMAQPVQGARFDHALIVDGQVAGYWRRLTTTRTQVIELLLLRPLTVPEEDAVQSAVERYAVFTGVPAMLKVADESGSGVT